MKLTVWRVPLAEMTDNRFNAPSDASDVRPAVIAAGAALEHAGVEHGEYEAVLLLAWAAGCEPGDVRRAMLMGETMDVFLSHCAGMPQSVLARFDDALRRRCAREPLQYITGSAPFRYLTVSVGPGVFIPRPETEQAVQLALDWLKSHGITAPKAVDLCAGSGVIGLSIATELPRSEVWAVELEPQALRWTLRNARRICGDADSSVDAAMPSDYSSGSALGSSSGSASGSASSSWDFGNYHLVHADALNPATLQALDGTADVVVTNPPYVPLDTPPEQPEVVGWDPDTALYGGSGDGLHIPMLLLRRIRTLLRPGGLVVMEHDITQGAALREAALRMGFVRPRTKPDLTGRDRFLVAFRDGQ